MRKRTRRSDRKTGANSKPKTSASPQRSALFGPPLLLEGEDAAAYDQLLARCAAVKPVDVIDEMLMVDVVSQEGEVLRWRRLKWSLIRGHKLEALGNILGEHLAYFSSDFNFSGAFFRKNRRTLRRTWLYECFRTSLRLSIEWRSSSMRWKRYRQSSDRREEA